MSLKFRKNYTPRKPLVIGEKYWRLLCLSEAGVNKRNKKLYLFKCDCGNEYKGLGTWVRMGRAKSCGCLFAEYAKSESAMSLRRKNAKLLQKPAGISARNAAYSAYKDRARRANLNFLLTIEEFEKLTQMNCAYCSSPPSNICGTERKGRYIYNGLDRVDSKKGYELSNCKPCCKKCNWAKSDMTLYDFTLHIKKIYDTLFKKV